MTETQNAAPNQSPGQILAAKREARGWSVAEVAGRLKYSARQIQALESDTFGALPGTAVVRGMVRGYAKAVGIDPTPLLAMLDQRLKADAYTMNPVDMHVPFKESRKGSRVYLFLSVLVLAAVVGVVAEWVLRRPGDQPAPAAGDAPLDYASPLPAPPRDDAPEAPSPGTEAPPPEPPVAQPEEPVQAPPAIEGNKRLQMRFTGDAWVQIYDGRGRQLMSQLNRAGTQQNIEGRPPFKLVVGNVEGVELRYDGQLVDIAPHARNDVARLRLE